jgi:chromosome segregation ATPase
MMKRGLIGAGVAALALSLLFGAKAPSYVKTAFHHMRHSASDAIPIRFEIERARQELANLQPAIDSNIETVARAEEDVKELRGEIAAHQANLTRNQRELVALRRTLGSDGTLRTDSGATYSAEEIRKELRGRLEHCRESKQTLVEMQKTLKLREQAVASARQQLKEVMSQRRLLETQIEAIEARQKAIEAARATGSFAIDDSALARVKQTINELRKRQNVMVRSDELRGQYVDKHVPVDLEATGDVLREIDAEFGTSDTDKNL